VMTSIGIPFIQGGSEFMNTKKGHHNTYNLPDSINGYNWRLLDKNEPLIEYVKRLSAFRREYDIFSIDDHKAIFNRMRMHRKGYHVLGVEYEMTEDENCDKILIFHNGGYEERSMLLPAGLWTVVLDDGWLDGKYERKKVTKCVKIPRFSTTILKMEKQTSDILKRFEDD